jgi:hypothetical protein
MGREPHDIDEHHDRGLRRPVPQGVGVGGEGLDERR